MLRICIARIIWIYASRPQLVCWFRSALDNLYVADGVNITDSAFGGIGTFSRSYGGLGTGITTAFVKEVQVKTAGFEPQYGQSAERKPQEGSVSEAQERKRGGELDCLP